jgi:hypothetical protein
VPDARARIDPGRELRGKEKWKVEDLVCPMRELASTRAASSGEGVVEGKEWTGKEGKDDLRNP